MSRLLGHTDIKTTQVYAKIVSQDLDDAMNEFLNKKNKTVLLHTKLLH